MALAFPVLFLPGERDVTFSEPGANQQEGRWVLEGIFWGRNNRTEEGDRLVSSGVKFQGFMEARVRPMMVLSFASLD